MESWKNKDTKSGDDGLTSSITWSIFFDHAFDCSMVFDEFKRPLTLFAPSLLVFSYSHHFEMHAQAHDKLLRALTTSDLKARILRDKEWLMLLKPLWHSLGAFGARAGIMVLTLLPSLDFILFSFYLIADITLCFCW